jgi:MoaA/NifB/PqqE/SkfB family radical SAM enzyme
MKMIYRQEYFGALLYNLENWRLSYLDQKKARKYLEENCDRLIIHQCPKDHYLSSPLKVFIGISSQCNLRCRHCVVYKTDTQTADIDLDSVKRIIKQLSDIGVLEIRLSGGEPTSRKDFFTIVTEAKKHNLTVSINSNGIYTNEIRGNIVESGIDRVHISLDGLEKQNDYIRGKGVFKEVVSSIEYLRSRGQYIRVVVCLFKDNLSDIPGLIKLTEGLDCDIKFSPIAKVGKAENMDRLLTIEECESVKQFFAQKHFRVNVFYNHGTMISEFKDYCELEDFDSNICGAGRTQLRVELNGDIFGAGCGDVDKNKTPLGTRDDSIIDIWQKAQSIMLTDMKHKGGACLDCDLSKVMPLWLNSVSPSFNFRRARN